MARKMKDSGIEWIGEIPEEWELVRINGLYKLRTTKVDDSKYPPLSVTKNGIVPQLESAAKTNDHANRKLVKKGDFVINSRSDRKGSCGISAYDGSVSLINTVLEPMGEMEPEYYDWLFNTSLFAEEFYKWGSGIVDDLWTTNWNDMKRMTVPLPKLDIQRKIAKCLNNVVGNLDYIAATITQEIEILEAYKKSLISEAVTKGLDKNVKMKDSGIEWIGEIPEKWGVGKLKYFLSNKLQYGASETGVEFDEKLPRYIRITDIDENNRLKEENKLSLTEEQARGYILDRNVVLFARSGATVGKTFFYTKELGYAAFAGYLIAAKCNEQKLLTKWLYYFTLSHSYEQWVNQVFTVLRQVKTAEVIK